MPPELTVIIPAHNPHPGRLRRVQEALRRQSLPAARWETVLVDNASASFPSQEECDRVGPANQRIVREARLGLTSARMRGLGESRAPVCVLVDDDNELAPDYLEQTLELFRAHPRVGALGGKVLPEFEVEPAPWMREFFPLLALRDLGDRPSVSTGLRPSGAAANEYPVDSAPVGAGMALRREAWLLWWEEVAAGRSLLTDRRGGSLSSSGDNDIVLTIMEHGWEVGYFPSLILTHLIPAGRLDPRYFARLNRGIQQSWMQVLSKHAANPWPALSPAGAALRKGKAWFAYRAWNGHPAKIRWQGACGHFDGRIRLP